MNKFDDAIKKKILEEVDNFNNIAIYNNELNEKSLNRMMLWLNKCDCAFITAFRYKLIDIANPDKTYYGPNDNWTDKKIFTHEENREKNKLLKAELLNLKYGVTTVKRVYPEGMNNESSEESFFVVNRFNDPNFLNNLLSLAEYFNQDSIYYKPKDKTYGYLIGTNGATYPGYHKKGDESKLKPGSASNFMSRIGNKAFSFIPNNALKVNNRKEGIENTDVPQRYWTDYEGTSFKDRKRSRVQEATDFWKSICVRRMEVLEEMEPRGRWAMGDYINMNLRNARNKPKLLK